MKNEFFEITIKNEELAKKLAEGKELTIEDILKAILESQDNVRVETNMR